MTLSTNLAENATLVGPPIAILLAFLGWRFRPRREIEVEKTEATLINVPQDSDDLKLLVRHRDSEIEQPVVSALVFVRNTGNRDISREDFVEPLALLAPPNHQILSCRFGAPPGVKLDPSYDLGEFRDGPDAVYVRWNLLKPRQRISFRLILAKTDQKFSIDPSERISHTALLKDVSSRSGLFSAVNRDLFLRLARSRRHRGLNILEPADKTPGAYVFDAERRKNCRRFKECRNHEILPGLDEPRSPEVCDQMSNDEAKALTYVDMERVAWRSRFPFKFTNYWWVLTVPLIFVAIDFRKDASLALRHLLRFGRT